MSASYAWRAAPRVDGREGDTRVPAYPANLRNLSSFEMKKWKIAQRKMAWQVSGDRNIGGHTARIPDTFHFLAGSGPRGVGIDLSSKDLIEKLAAIIIPETTVSKRNQLCLKLESRWMEHHGKGQRKNSSFQLGKRGSRSSRTSGSHRDIASLFDNTPINQETVQNMIAQLKLAASASEPALEPALEEEDTPSSDEDAPTEGEAGTEAPEPTSETEAEPEPELETDPPPDPPEPEPPTCPNTAAQRNRLRSAPPGAGRAVKRSNRDASRPHPQRAAQQNQRKQFKNSKRSIKTGSTAPVRPRKEGGRSARKSHTPDQTLSLVQKHNKGRHSVTPDSGFHSDTKSSSLSNLSKPNSPALRLQTSDTRLSNLSKPNSPALIKRQPSDTKLALGKLSRTVSDIFKQKSSQNLKTRRSETELNRAASRPDLSAVPENALLWLRKKSTSRGSASASPKSTRSGLWDTGGSRHAQQMKKACRVTEVVSILTRNKFIMPTLDNYEVTGVPKDGQSFTRRRTRGQMYSTLEPMVYSDVYKRSNSGFGTFANHASTLTRMKNAASGFF